MRSPAMLSGLRLALVAALGMGSASGQDAGAQRERQLGALIARHCAECHEGAKAKGGFRVDTLEDLPRTAHGVLGWSLVREQVHLRKMPRGDGLDPKDIAAILSAVDARLAHVQRDAQLAEFSGPDLGNLVPHDRLFDPAFAATRTPSTPARIWRASPEAFEGILRSASKYYAPESNPLALPSHDGIRDYAAVHVVDEPVAEQLIQLAKHYVESITSFRDTTQPIVRKIKRVGERGTEYYPIRTYRGKSIDGRYEHDMSPELWALFDPGRELTAEVIRAAVRHLHVPLHAREPTADELAQYESFMRTQVAALDRVPGVRAGLVPLALEADVLFRTEVGGGRPDAHGRRRLTATELALALSYALDEGGRFRGQFLAAAKAGKLDGVEGIRAILAAAFATIYAKWNVYQSPWYARGDQGGNINYHGGQLPFPKLSRFFEEYFGYRKVVDVFKDVEANKDYKAGFLAGDTWLLIERIASQDKDVLRELLTTDGTFVMSKHAKLDGSTQDQDAKAVKRGVNVARIYGLDARPGKQPVPMPGRRMGILTQPSWLAAWSQADHNDAIRRGKWIRERLLGGVIPPVPISVDAQLPNVEKLTLREKMGVTRQDLCWRCHQRMDPLGLPFERFDHWGQYREQELGKAVATDGGVLMTGDPRLDGPVKDPFELIRRLADSERVRQVFVRHVFRFWMGRNETLDDAPTLIAADKAYVASGGSLRALLTSLLTSDSFLYRSDAVGSERTASAQRPTGR